jgi:phospholipid/cholesterol/gamma-HCH transport system substrate-binding protein
MRGVVAPLVKLVVFLVVTAFATYVLAATINNSSFGSTHSYNANFTDAAGLQIGDDVRIAGVRVGTVEGISIVHKAGKQSYARVAFTVSKSRPLPKSVHAIIRYRNLVGQRYLDVEQCANDGSDQCTGDPNDELKPGGTISIKHTQPAVDLTVLFAGFRPLVQGLSADQINQLSYQVIQTLQGESGSFESLLSTVGDLTNTLADKDKVIGEVIDNLTGVLQAVASHDNELSDLIVQLRRFLSGLADDRTTIGNAIDGINGLATSTAGLLTQVRAPLAKDIKSISRLAGTLNANRSTIKYVIDELPPTVAGLIRTADYGSWFNFYLCTVSGIISYPNGTSQHFKFSEGSQARCKS